MTSLQQIITKHSSARDYTSSKLRRNAGDWKGNVSFPVKIYGEWHANG